MIVQVALRSVEPRPVPAFHEARSVAPAAGYLLIEGYDGKVTLVQAFDVFRFYLLERGKTVHHFDGWVETPENVEAEVTAAGRGPLDGELPRARVA
jgi:hypothetical protein